MKIMWLCVKLLLGVFIICTLIGVSLMLIEREILRSKEQLWCRMNIEQFAKSLSLYKLDYGKQQYFPQRIGQGFLLSLYENGIFVEEHCYLCNSTDDENSTQELINATDNGDEDGPVSYAGRKNDKPNVYPGLFRVTENLTTTPIVSDDIGEENNHGDSSHFLFLDLHIEFLDEDQFPDLDVLGN